MSVVFKTIGEVRAHVEKYMEEFNAKVESRIAGVAHTMFSFPAPANVITENELNAIILEQIKEESNV